MSEEIKMPESIHHSHQHQQMDLGETIRLYKGKGPGHQGIIGVVYNFEEIPGLPDSMCEDYEIDAIAIADKMVRGYNSIDALIEACEAALVFIARAAPQAASVVLLEAVAKAKGESK